jgi:hypothetical protein
MMDVTHLVNVRAMLFEDSGDWCQKGIFVSLSSDMPTPNISTLGMLDRLTLAVRSIIRHEWSMLTAMERLDWTRNQADSNKHLRSRWNSYASADIEFWHVNFRSLLDQVALVISELAGIKNEKLKKSFRKLYNKSCSTSLHTPKSAAFGKQLGPEWLALLQSSTWFDQIVSVRDAIVHLGGHTMLFEDPSKGILFQVYGARYQRLVKDAPLVYNENVVFFDRYAAHLMSHLLMFLEDFARVVYGRVMMSRKPPDTASNCGPGWGTLRSWIDSTLAAVAPPSQ